MRAGEASRTAQYMALCRDDVVTDALRAGATQVVHPSTSSETTDDPRVRDAFFIVEPRRALDLPS